MNNFIRNINELFSFYEGEISQLKKIMVNTKIASADKELIMKYAIPIFYSHWEGFFVKALTEYINFINSLSLNLDAVKDEIVAHSFDGKFNLKNPRSDFEKIKQYVLDMKSFFQNSIFYLDPKIDTKSNLNYKAANEILNRLCLDILPAIREKELNRLLMFRNNIAHGECSVPNNHDIITEMSRIVINCIGDLFIIIDDGIHNSRFKKV